MKKIFSKEILNQKGQALFEMILFLPFLMFLYTIYYSAGNSINGSINQQKAVRGYYYALVKGNSYLNTNSELLDFLNNHGIGNVGFNSLGWNDHQVGNKPFAPCFKFSSLLKNNSTEECDSGDRDGEGTSRFIRLFTFYGVCGPHYTSAGNSAFVIMPEAQASWNSCTLGN